MLKVNKVVTPSAEQWKITIEGARNPMNSWARSDSTFRDGNVKLGPNDLSLLERLARAGRDHRKYLRMLHVNITVTAPLYWWKEYDTYKIGTTTNSCSTMHKVTAKEFEFSDFSIDHLLHACSCDEFFYLDHKACSPLDVLDITIQALNRYRDLYRETGDKLYWQWIIQLLPTSYNQMRTLDLNYEVLANIYHSRRHHKLVEWHTFCDAIETLPYSHLITGGSTTPCTTLT